MKSPNAGIWSERFKAIAILLASSIAALTFAGEEEGEPYFVCILESSATNEGYNSETLIDGPRIVVKLEDIASCINLVSEEFLQDLESVSDEELLEIPPKAKTGKRGASAKDKPPSPASDPKRSLPLGALYDVSYDAFLPTGPPRFLGCGFRGNQYDSLPNRNYQRILDRLYKVSFPTFYTLPCQGDKALEAFPRPIS